MAKSQRRCRVEKVKGGKSRQSESVSKLHAVAKNVTNTQKATFQSYKWEKHSFFRDAARPFAEQLHFDSPQEADKHAALRRRKTATLWYTQKNGNFKLNDLLFFPGLLATTVEKLQVFRDLFCLYVLAHWLCPHCRRHFSCARATAAVHLNSNRAPTCDFFHLNLNVW